MVEQLRRRTEDHARNRDVARLDAGAPPAACPAAALHPCQRRRGAAASLGFTMSPSPFPVRVRERQTREWGAPRIMGQNSERAEKIMMYRYPMAPPAFYCFPEKEKKTASHLPLSKNMDDFL